MPPIRAGLAGATAMAIVLPLPEVTWLLVAAGIVAVTTLALLWAPGGALLSDASEASGLDQGFAFGLMNLAWAGGQVVGGAAGGGLADLTVGRGALRDPRGGCARATFLRVRGQPQLGQGAVPRAR